ncbi:MAG: hypothetical protein Q9191_000856 [Dirinaria sp. TL-2023a]
MSNEQLQDDFKKKHKHSRKFKSKFKFKFDEDVSSRRFIANEKLKTRKRKRDHKKNDAIKKSASDDKEDEAANDEIHDDVEENSGSILIFEKQLHAALKKERTRDKVFKKRLSEDSIKSISISNNRRTLVSSTSTKSVFKNIIATS